MNGLDEKLKLTEKIKNAMKEHGRRNTRPLEQAEVIVGTKKVKWTKMGDSWYQGAVNAEEKPHGLGCKVRSDRFELGQY